MSTNTGDSIVRNSLRMARNDANRYRLRGYGDDAFSRVMQIGKVLITEIYLDADPLLVHAAINEIHFLRQYTEARA